MKGSRPGEDRGVKKIQDNTLGPVDDNVDLRHHRTVTLSRGNGDGIRPKKVANVNTPLPFLRVPVISCWITGSFGVRLAGCW